MLDLYHLARALPAHRARPAPLPAAPQDAVGAAILAANAATLLALAYPLAAPRAVGAARKLARAARRCCGPEAALLLSCAWPCASASDSREHRSRRGCGAATTCMNAARGLGSWGQLWWRCSRAAAEAEEEPVSRDCVPPVWWNAVVGRSDTLFGAGGDAGDSTASGLRLPTSAGLAQRPPQLGLGGVALTLHGCPSARQGGLQTP